MVLLVNLFFPPVLFLYLYCDRQKKPLVFSALLAAEYGVAVVAVYLPARFLFSVACLLGWCAFDLESLVYTFLAVVVSAVLPFAAEFFRRLVSVRLTVSQNEK